MSLIKSAFLKAVFFMVSLVFAWDLKNLSASQTTKASILEQHDKVNDSERVTRNFKGPTVAYVTPWNFGGYEFVTKFCTKIDIVVPVWYHVFPTRKTFRYKIEGSHNILHTWLQDIKKCNPKIKIVPRFVFEKWKPDDFQNLISTEEALASLASGIIAELQENVEYDGIVLETGVPQYLKPAFEILMKIIRATWRTDAMLIIPISPPRREAGGRAWDLELLTEFSSIVDYFSVMTYDYFDADHLSKASPVAPISWIEGIFQDSFGLGNKDQISQGLAKKLLMGINFYGYRYINANYGNPEAITGGAFIEALKKYNIVVKWDDNYAENKFIYDDENSATYAEMYFPSLKSINFRLKLAEKLGLGIGIWEAGQGLVYWGALL